MGEFMKDAAGLTRNPLGIIALFISLIYGFACLVVGFGASQIDKSLQAPLVYFLIIFPVLILIMFVYLVVFHHHKLYAPKDFHKEDNFFRSTSIVDQNEKLSREIVEMQPDDCTPQVAEESQIDEESQIEEGPISTESVEGVLNDEASSIVEKGDVIKEVAQTCNHEKSIMMKNAYNLRQQDIMKEYMLIEDLAMRKLSQDFNIQIQRQVSLKLRGNDLFNADGAAMINGDICIFEVKYINGSTISKRALNSIESTIRSLNEQGPRLKLIFAIVHSKGTGDLLRRQINGMLGNKSSHIEFKFYSEKYLKESFSIK